MTKLYGSLEAGGTKFVCAVGDEQFQVVEKTQFPTTTPYETIERTVEFFKRYEERLAGIAIGSFGPIDIDQNSSTYGYITSTPKPHWSNIDLLGLIAKEFNIPFYFTTDVNSSAFGETLVRKGVKSLVYYTIGTGIGAGAIQNGEFIGGLGHSEVWDVQAYYIAQAAVQATLLYRPQVIVFGGGVMAQEHMLNRVREKFVGLMNNYLPTPDVKEYIVTPAVAENGSATLGNFALARKVSEK